MKKPVITLLLLLPAMLAWSYSKITRTYVQQPLSEVLIDIDKAAPEIHISFIYNKLEDYPVTCSFNNAEPIEAIRQAIGFYPVRMSQTGNCVIIEPLYDTDSKVSGRIVDQEGLPLEFANVAVLSTTDSTLICGSVTNVNGDFVIPCPEERVLLKASYIGFRTAYQPCTVGHVGEICLQEDAITLNEVKKSGQRPLARMERGTLVYDMQRLNSIMPADNAYEALTRIPAVSENNDEIEFAGRKITLVINGKATSLSAEQVKERLKQMPTDRLAKAEVMMSAPPQYHVRGAVINVVTKDTFGHNELSGLLQGGGILSKRSHGYGSGAMLFAQGKFTLDANYNYTGGNKYQKAGHYAIQPLTSGTEEYNDMNESRSHFIVHQYRLGMEYAFAKDHRIEAVYNGRWTQTRNHNTASGTTPSEQHSITHIHVNNADVTYKTPFGLNIGTSYTHFEYPQQQNLEAANADDMHSYLSESRQKIDKWNLTADKSHKFKHNWGLNYGAQSQITRHESWQNTHRPSGQKVEAATGSVDYTEHISSIYASLNKDWGQKVSAEVGAQAENYHTPNRNNSSGSQPKGYNEWRIYPTLNLLWRANANNNVNLSLSSNSSYPDYWSLMNSIYYSSAYSEIWGNPYLKPMSSYELSLMWQFRQRYTVTAFYSHEDNFFVQLPFQPSDRLAVIMQETNFNFRVSTGIVATAQWKIGRWASGNVTAAALYLHDKSDNFHDIPFDRKKISGQISGTAAFSIWPGQNLMFIAQPVYQANTIQGVFDIHNFVRLNLSLRWTDKSGRLSASVKGDNLTNMHFQTADTWRGQYYIMNVWQNYRNLQLTLSYKLGNYKDKQRKAIDTSRMGH